MYILTKDACPKCHNLMRFADNILSPEERALFTVVNKETDPAKYQELVTQYAIQSLPALIDSKGELIRVVQPPVLKAAIKAAQSPAA